MIENNMQVFESYLIVIELTGARNCSLLIIPTHHQTIPGRVRERGGVVH